MFSLLNDGSTRAVFLNHLRVHGPVSISVLNSYLQRFIRTLEKKFLDHFSRLFREKLVENHSCTSVSDSACHLCKTSRERVLWFEEKKWKSAKIL